MRLSVNIELQHACLDSRGRAQAANDPHLLTAEGPQWLCVDHFFRGSNSRSSVLRKSRRNQVKSW